MPALSNSTFIPELWSARLLAHLNKSLVFKNTVNTNYEGEIKNFGDTVHINLLDNITISSQGGDHAPTMNSITTNSYDEVLGIDRTLTIDQARWFAFKVSDVNAIQANIDAVDEAMANAAYGLSDSVDQYIASFYTEAGGLVGDDTTPIAATSANAYENLVKLYQKLDEMNVPTENRYVVVPPAFYALLLLDDRFVKAGTTKTDEVLATGYVGEVAGFKVYKSNNVAKSSDKYKIVAGHPMAITFAQQLIKTEALRDQNSFADLVRGLLIFGAKCVHPDALAVLTATI